MILIMIIIHNHHNFFDADVAYQEQQRSTLVKWRQAGGTGQILMMFIKSDQSQVRYWASESSTTMRMIMMIVMTCNEGGWEYLSWWWSSKVIKVPISDSCGHWSHLRGWQGDSNRTEQVSHSLLLSFIVSHSCCHILADLRPLALSLLVVGGYGPSLETLMILQKIILTYFHTDLRKQSFEQPFRCSDSSPYMAI